MVAASVQRRQTGLERFRLGRVFGPVALFAGVGLALAVVNAVSTNTEYGWRHVRLDPREPYVWELTSWCGLLVGFAPLLIADRGVQAARSWLVRGLIAAVATLGYSAAHIGTMIALRLLIYGSAGAHYDFGPIVPGVLFEYRKDVITVVMALVVFWLWRRALPRPLAAAQTDAAEPAFFAESRQGRVLLRAPEIDWVEAQGNYVALHAGGRSYLIRQPLKAMDERLRAAAFVRTHRSALVNTRRVRAIRRDGGGLRVELANQEFAPLSDRHKAAVVKALSPS